ncbi:MAG: AAA family ATPase [Kiritimatiellae bacterium]|nr:AAA family ATPase [Kiritimatiellia bacterium]
MSTRITGIKLQNFRAFQSAIEVRVRPITVLIGRNSAGKSSLLKFLLMLRQTLESQGDDFFVTEGEHVHLGTWADLRHTCTRESGMIDSALHYVFEMETEDLPRPEVRQLWKAASRADIVTETAAKFILHAELLKQPPRKESETGHVSVKGAVQYGSKFSNGRHDVECTAGSERLFAKSARNLQDTGFLRFGQREESIANLLENVAAERFLEPLRHTFISQRHLSPIREESQQTVQMTSPPAGDVGHRGEYAIPHLWRLWSREDLRAQWDFVAQSAAAVAEVDNIEFKSQVARLLTKVTAQNRRTGATCSLGDFGFGVSQCLPIFVQGAMHSPGQLLLVEQPEAQLHPTAQLELGSFFAALWKDRRVPSVIETHSGNILLRLRKLVSQGELTPEDISVAYFHVDNVSRERGSPIKAVCVKNLDIGLDGSMEKGLPMEFFGADIREALDFGRGTP